MFLGFHFVNIKFYLELINWYINQLFFLIDNDIKLLLSFIYNINSHFVIISIKFCSHFYIILILLKSIIMFIGCVNFVYFVHCVLFCKRLYLFLFFTKFFVIQNFTKFQTLHTVSLSNLCNLFNKICSLLDAINLFSF